MKIVAALAVAAFLVYHGTILYRTFRLRNTNPVTTAFMDQRAKEAAARGGSTERVRVWVTYDQISPSLVHAVVVAEDQRFYSHSGLDWGAIRLAIKINWGAKRIVRGASTIDQQLAKNLFLSSSRNPLRKLHEGLIAWEMDRILGKRRVLELYLNVIEWGEGIYGAEAAARHYFKASAASLTEDQAAFLAAMIPNPRGDFNPTVYPDRVNYRRDVILASMKEEPVPELTLRDMAVQTVMPTFPEEAIAKGAEGVTISRVSIDANGNVTKVEVLAAPHPAIKTSLVEALTKWKFNPPNMGDKQTTITGKLSFYYSILNGEGIVRNPMIHRGPR